MPTGEGTKARKAVAERNGNGKVKSVKWRGMDLTLTDKTPGYLLFEDEADLTTIPGAMRFLRAMLGEEQYAQVRAKVEADGLDFDAAEKAVLNSPQSLFSKVAGALGTSAGESSASAGS